MAGARRAQRVLELFAELLEYPWRSPADAVAECQALLAAEEPEAAARLARFRAFVERTPLGRIQEIYGSIFELSPSCPPYVGYHLLGETYKRSAFLVGLRERYATQDYRVEGELPDHLAVMLRFLARAGDGETSRELVTDALLPALERMRTVRDDAVAKGRRRVGAAAYADVLRALTLMLSSLPRGDRRSPAAEEAPVDL